MGPLGAFSQIAYTVLYSAAAPITPVPDYAISSFMFSHFLKLNI